MHDFYSSEAFEAQYTYPGSDLGAVWSREKTTFRLWAPTASRVAVKLYKTGDPNACDQIGQLEMLADVNGTWIAEHHGDLNGVYYTYLAEVGGNITEACDPYARTTGINGHRAMVIDLAATNPTGWENDADPHAGKPITDAVIYELHIRDLSMDESSGIRHKGKYLGLTETGTTNAKGIPTGLDHIKTLGVTHVHLLPVYDFGSVDETRLNVPQFNWGYDPVNYNVPDGSYATDPANGQVRVAEMKQMVKILHENGLSVIMDVVYNHVYDGGNFCFNRLVPGYFSRIGKDGVYSNGSGCGNDTASERSMVRKYIVDSVCYWADEYHIDGFRFDLVGLLDAQTVNAIVAAVHEKHPNVIFYGEGWSIPSGVTKPGILMATQQNAAKTPGFAYFSDTMRDALRGHVFNDHAKGYVSGQHGFAGAVTGCFAAGTPWTKDPKQIINYASCHDNMTLFDRLTLSNPDTSMEQRIRMNNLAAAIYLLSQGVPFLQAGEEMLRSKPRSGGGFEHNSYNLPDSVNSLKWDTMNLEVRDYYKGLIAFRKANPALRMTDHEQIAAHIQAVQTGYENVLAFHISKGANGEEKDLFVIFNPHNDAVTVRLPQGSWDICIQDNLAGTESLGTAREQVTVSPISATVLVSRTETAYFAGGCFWCITPTFQEMDGVQSVISGYSGGDEANPTYEDVKNQRTGHRETIRIDYSPDKVDFAVLFQIFLDSVDPFDSGGQFIDRGHSYTLAVYYCSAQQRRIAEDGIKQLEAQSGKPVYISVEPFRSFYPAEEYHQDYYRKHPEEFKQELIDSGRIQSQ